MRTLFIQFDENAHPAIEQILRQRGHEVERRVGPEEALAEVRRRFYPIVFLEAANPTRIADFCRRFRALPDGAESILVLHSCVDHTEALGGELRGCIDDLLCHTDPPAILERRIALAEHHAEAGRIRRWQREDRDRLFDLSLEMLCIASFDGYFTQINPAWEVTLGHTTEELCSRPFIEFVHPEDIERTAAEAQRLMVESAESVSFENRYRHKDGSYRNLLWKTSVSEQRRQYYCVTRDVTLQRQLEGQLLEARKLESVGQLAAGIAHEINTPLQYIGDNLRFLRDLFEGRRKAGTNEQELRGAIDDSLRGIGHVEHIVGALREFSHPGDSRGWIAVNDSVRNAVTIARSEWKLVASVKTELADDLPVVRGNSIQINQALLNLLINAAQAVAERGPAEPESSNGKGHITVKTSVDEKSVAIAIEDDGVGIPEEALSRIFDPFYTTKRVGEGTGQGLTIAHDIIVRRHGGAIDVASERGAGTRFVVRLPRQEVEAT